MSVWLVRAGRHGENEQAAIDNNLVTIGWNALPDLSSVQDREELSQISQGQFSNAGTGKVSNHVGQLRAFRSRIEIGDLAILPLKRM